MANYHLTTKNISRASGKSCVASLAYRSATKLIDHQTGENFDYLNKPFVQHVVILLPENAPSWIQDIVKECKASRQIGLQKLSDKFESAEKRRDARVYREIEFSLPNELTEEQNVEWATRFVEDTCVKRGMVAIMNFHLDVDEKTGEDKPHCHVLLSTRELTEVGFSRYKQRDWNRVELLQDWREQYAEYQNLALKTYGCEVRVDHRSYAERGLKEVVPQPKRGKAVSQMTMQGLKTVKQANFDLIRLKNQFQILKNPELVFSIVTSNHSTFTGKEVAKVLNRYIDSATQYHILYQRLMGSKELVPLDSNKSIFTTRTMLRLEKHLIETAERLSAQKTHTIESSVTEQVIFAHNKKLAPYGGLSLDQQIAIRHMLAGHQMACVVGFAGAGETTSLEAVKEAWQPFYP